MTARKRRARAEPKRLSCVSIENANPPAGFYIVTMRSSAAGMLTANLFWATP